MEIERSKDSRPENYPAKIARKIVVYLLFAHDRFTVHRDNRSMFGRTRKGERYEQRRRRSPTTRGRAESADAPAVNASSVGQRLRGNGHVL